ncbi:hypothetical protein BDN70DRAFT_902170, partial [Pholiota conissans]
MPTITFEEYMFPTESPTQTFDEYVDQFQPPSPGFSNLSEENRLLFTSNGLRRLGALVLSSVANTPIPQLLAFHDQLVRLIKLFLRAKCSPAHFVDYDDLSKVILFTSKTFIVIDDHLYRLRRAPLVPGRFRDDLCTLCFSVTRAHEDFALALFCAGLTSYRGNITWD